jgi:hypothetical protein
LAETFAVEHRGDAAHAHAVAQAIETLRALPPPQPLIGDRVERWLPTRIAAALQAAGIDTLAALTLRVPRRRRWWAAVPGLGATGARQVEGFFAAHPELTERARALVVVPALDVRPWERKGLDGSQGRFRAPRESCALDARDDYAAVQAWLERHESEATRRAYRKEAERLILWAVLERGKALSSLATEDATALPRLPAPARACGALDRAAAAAAFAGVAAVRRSAVGTLHQVHALSAGRLVPLAGRAALRAGQPVCRHEGARRLIDGAAGRRPRLLAG